MRFVKATKKQGKDEVHVTVAMSSAEYINYKYHDDKKFFSKPITVLSKEELEKMTLTAHPMAVAKLDEISTFVSTIGSGASDVKTSAT